VTELTRAGVADELSASLVLRILAEHPVKPWQYRSRISPRHPDFEARAARPPDELTESPAPRLEAGLPVLLRWSL
jgi:hypothetical protein